MSQQTPELTSLSCLLPPPIPDPRYTHRTALLHNHTYSYIHALPPPSTPQRATILLIHGFPDLSFAWRNQIPILTNMGFQVIAPDCLGYGRSDSPPSSNIASYTTARMADDMELLCAQLGISEIFLGGHDWGAATAYRIALLKPHLVKVLFTVCVPYDPPKPMYTPLAQLVARRVPNFAYQMHFASGEVEEVVQGREMIRGFLNALYGARCLGADDGTGKGEAAFEATGKVKLDLLSRMGKNKLLSDEEMDFYVTEYARHGINGPLNWYRVREANFVSELDLIFDGPGTDASKYQPGGEWMERTKIMQPTLFIGATKDQALPEWMAKGMDANIPRLTRKMVDAGHWVLWQRPKEVNGILEEWLGERLKEWERERNGKL